MSVGSSFPERDLYARPAGSLRNPFDLSVDAFQTRSSKQKSVLPSQRAIEAVSHWWRPLQRDVEGEQSHSACSIEDPILVEDKSAVGAAGSGVSTDEVVDE